MKTNTEIIKEKLKEIEKRNKVHREKAKRLKIAPPSDGGWDDTINLEGELKGMQTAIKSELEFLEWLFPEIETFAGKQETKERITDCKNALKLIGENK